MQLHAAAYGVEVIALQPAEATPNVIILLVSLKHVLTCFQILFT